MRNCLGVWMAGVARPVCDVVGASSGTGSAAGPDSAIALRSCSHCACTDYTRSGGAFAFGSQY